MADLETLSTLADEADTLESQINNTEEALRTLKKKFTYLTEEQLPEIMKAIGLKKITTNSGLDLEHTTKVRCNNSKERKPNIIKWLFAIGQGAAVERVIQVPFGLGDDESNEADIVKAALGDIKRPFVDDQSVNTNRLNALVDKLLEDGEEVDLDMLGAFIHDKVKIKRK